MSPASTAARIARERQTVQCMVEIYCRKQNKGTGLCPECRGLLEYALERIEKCPFQEDKPTCRKCPVHCYKKDRREEVRRVMSFAGRWMVVVHPGLTVLHSLDEWGRKIPRTG